MNEWDLQSVLTKQWAECGLTVDGERHLLVAWEVMTPSWLINDPDHHWTEPSVDFLVVNARAQFTVIELKTKVPGIKPAWQTLCQVTHRAANVSATLSLANLEKAHGACWSGKHGRLPTSAPRSFASHFESFFARKLEAIEAPGDVRRCVAAVQFGESWPEVLAEFNRLSGDELRKRVCEELTSQQSRRELDRFNALCEDNRLSLSQPVIEMPLA